MEIRPKKAPRKPKIAGGAPEKEDGLIIHLRLPMSTVRDLDKLAAEYGTSRNAMAQIAIGKLIKTGL